MSSPLDISHNLGKIGVLGGMGPHATVLFMQRILEQTPAKDDCDHIPLLVDNNTQVPSRIKALIEGNGPNPGPVLAQMARTLEQAGAKALVMPCNTAHHYTPDIRQAISIPFLSMIELSAQELALRVDSGASVGILASPAVKITGVFNAELSRLQLNPVYPASDAALLTAIKTLKASPADGDALEIVLGAATELKSLGAEIILIGCTEFSLLKDQIKQVHTAMDSLDILVAHSIEFSKSTKISSGTGGAV